MKDNSLFSVHTIYVVVLKYKYSENKRTLKIFQFSSLCKFMDFKLVVSINSAVIVIIYRTKLHALAWIRMLARFYLLSN